MANKKYQIKINSILGGESPLTHFSKEDQFRASLGIDPSLPIDDDIGYGGNNVSAKSSGLLRPVACHNISGTTLSSSPMWFEPGTNISYIYVYDYVGSFYTLSNGGTLTPISDAGELVNSRGNGIKYYDNYIYLAKNTTIARYGPLNGTATLNGNYWTSTLSKTALTDTQYYVDDRIFKQLPNHVMHRHSDGRLYIADVVDNRGTIHYISTKKTTVEGDTDNGSTYTALQFGYKQWPTAIESHGSNLVIGLYEADQGGDSVLTKSQCAKIAFWDTVSQNFNTITMDEFPDNIITSIRNVNGTLYITSGNTASLGFRVSKYLGGSSFEEIAYIDRGQVPFPGAVYASGERFVFGSSTDIPESAGCLYSIGLGRPKIFGNGIFTIARVTSTDVDPVVTAVTYDNNYPSNHPFIGWGDSNGDEGIDYTFGQPPSYAEAPSVWWSQTYKIGQPFKITKIRIPLAQQLTGGVDLTAKIYLDSGTGTFPFQTITSTQYGTATQSIVLRPANNTTNGICTGDDNFFLELRWTGSDVCTVSLPITIEYELLDIDTAYP